MILSCQNLSKTFVDRPILKQASFQLEEHEKAAIVGVNGAGKTTLLKMIIGQLPADEGLVTFAKDKTFGYLAQQSDLSSSNTIYEELLSVKQDLVTMEQKLRDLEESMKHCEGAQLEEIMDRYTRMTHDFEVRGGLLYKSELIGVLKGLSFLDEDFDKQISTLSGGQKTRVSLAKLLLQSPDLIILDEPTNHLDIASISWLETYLRSYKGAVLIVSHDRYFLDRVVTKVIAIENGLVRSYAGNYSDYAAKAAMLRKAAVNAYLKQQEEIHHQQQVIDKLKSFNREKSIKRAESREKMLDKMELLEKPMEIRDDMHLKLTPQIISGNDVLSIEDLSKHFGSLTLFEHVDIEIKRGEHVAIIGDNGTGKTTLLKIINELEAMDSGQIRLGSKVEIGYYDQEHHVLHSEKTLFDEISDDYPTLTNTQIRNTLAAFLFTGDDVFKKISELSGGERGRVSLAKLMLSNANFLILDEPTNHLDITSKEILEQALNDYEGTVLYVSHDRYFVNQTATRILDLHNKQFYSFAGNYDYYLEKKDVVEQPTVITQQNGQTASTGSCTDTAEPASDSKLSWQQQKEEQALKRKKENQLRKCEDDIAALEDEIAQLNEQMADPAIATDVAKLQELSKKQTVLQETLEQRYEEWEELSE
ncbi:ABC-F family ATP-binding cassette domain-containing protein [Kineothrix sp. MSJ-39]|uniref:ribosomal protection-like ABC-F family protein n=1 Tax=Kineothrix sp. MSJ-39 TaxID=2841533 RepID=UPI001C11715F|nr:ABC-F family ATP-binding cassette domain-containing protein [Kineothrix sp. MSJ-39]MBU5428474.1 ABC-F family ATP-binding cassette domain-containing protein [Kineothrix sp. MSJ-39]